MSATTAVPFSQLVQHPKPNLNWSPTRSPSLEMTCQLTVYTRAARGAVAVAARWR